MSICSQIMTIGATPRFVSFREGCAPYFSWNRSGQNPAYRGPADVQAAGDFGFADTRRGAVSGFPRRVRPLSLADPAVSHPRMYRGDQSVRRFELPATQSRWHDRFDRIQPSNVPEESTRK